MLLVVTETATVIGTRNAVSCEMTTGVRLLLQLPYAISTYQVTGSVVVVTVAVGPDCCTVPPVDAVYQL